MKKAVICTVQSQSQAERVVTDLQAAGFGTKDISVLFPNAQGTSDFALEHHTKAPEGAAAGAGTGGVLGGTLGLLAGLGALAIPGLGPFIAAGPILAALGGAAVGAGVGGVAGALIGMGFPEIEAKLYEDKIKTGNMLIAVHTDDREQQKQAEAVFQLARGRDISTMSESSAPRKAG